MSSIIPNQAPLPTWAPRARRSAQGGVIGPTLAVLAYEPDLLVATAGGRPIDAIPSPIPGNARLAQYLPFEWMLPWQRQLGYEL